MTRDRTTLAWAAALLLAGCSTGGENEADHAADPVALVKLAPAVQGAVAHAETVYGAAEAGPGARRALVAPAEGSVVSIDAPPGTPVRRGQVVARLSPSPATRLDLTKAASDATAANLALARAQRLRADGLGSDADVETTRAAARAANATRASLGSRTAGLVVRATEDGVVDTVTPSPGDLVQAGGPIASITRASEVRAKFGIEPSLARALRPGMTLRIESVAGRPATTVLIQSITPSVDPQTRLQSLFVRLPAAMGIVPGTTLSATITTPSGGEASTIPYAALLDDGGQPYVFVVARGVAHRRDVTVGATAGDRVAISGLRAGEQVVVQGGTAVEDGMKVRTR